MSELKYTDEQQQALETRTVGVALDAGAGCGKTFVLTERYLSHLDPAWSDPPAELSEVVAITFTDAAAREMRDRIRKKCRERFLKADVKAAPRWRRILESLDEARVSTIHSLCTTLIRQYAIELGIDPAFRVLDPAEAIVMRSESLDSTLRRKLLLPDGQPDPDLVQAAADLTLARLKESLGELGRSDGQPNFEKWAKKTPEACIEAWKEFYERRVLPIYIKKFLALPAVQTLREMLPMAEPITPGFAERIVAINETLQAIEESDEPHDALVALAPLLEIKHPGGGKGSSVYLDKDWPNKEIKKEFTATLATVRGHLKKQKHPASFDDSMRAAELGLQLQKLAIAALKDYRKIKRQAGLLDHDDLLSEARRLLTAKEFVNEQKRIASTIRVLLVDEFQDTDQNQVEIVRALVEAQQANTKGQVEASAEETEGGLADGRLFFVGDFKQSIYRFRGAEPEVFRNLQKATPAVGRLPLSTNFRSQPAVLEFINSLFGSVFGDDYSPLRPIKQQQTARPAVEFLWTPMPEPPEGKDKPLKRDRIRAEAATLAAHLRAMIDSGEHLVVDQATGETRPARPGDIALLFRALSDVQIFEVALREAGFDYYLVGGHTFYAQQEVYDLVNLLQSVESSCDDIALAGALRSPLFGLHDETLFWLTRRGALNEGLFAEQLPSELSKDQTLRVQQAQRAITLLRDLKNQLSVVELIRTAMTETNYDAVLLAEFLGERKLANLEKLIQQARRCDASGGNLRSYLRQLNEFIRRLTKDGDAATSSEEADVVRLMTVHGSKGLEFPIVVLPDLDRKPNHSTISAAYHEELGPVVRPPNYNKNPTAVGIDLYKVLDKEAEEREKERVFYVACTRAADRLVLSSTLGDPDKVEGTWLKILQKRFDLSTGKLIHCDTLEEGENGPLVRVPVPPAKLQPVEQTKRADLQKVLGKAITQAERSQTVTAAPRTVAPVVIRPEQLQTFSVSRLSGKLTQVDWDSNTPEPIADHVNDLELMQGIDSRHLGTLVHAVIERLDRTASNADLQQAIRRWSESLAPGIVGREAAKAACESTALLNRFITSEAWQMMQNAQRLDREVEFLMPWPSQDSKSLSASDPSTAMLRGYIDALLLDNNGNWHIVDYKTNLVTAEQVAAVAETYRLQLGVYALAVEQAVKTAPVSLSLCFLRPGIVHRFDWNKTVRLETIECVDAAIESVRQELVAAI